MKKLLVVILRHIATDPKLRRQALDAAARGVVALRAWWREVQARSQMDRESNGLRSSFTTSEPTDDGRGESGNRNNNMPAKKSSAKKSSSAKASSAQKGSSKKSGAKKSSSKKSAKKVSSKRELITPHKGDSRYIRRDAQGRIKESDDVGRSLKQDRARKAKTKVKSGQGDRGDR